MLTRSASRLPDPPRFDGVDRIVVALATVAIVLGTIAVAMVWSTS